ncbi:MAG: signal peptidase I [Acidobacteriota bacterium]
MRLVLICGILLFNLGFAGCKGLAYKNLSEGMVPTIKVNDAFLTNPFEYSGHAVERFDMVLFEPPAANQRSGKEERWVKRVVGLPGERLSMKGGKVFINGDELAQPFEKIEVPASNSSNGRDFPEIEIPADEYFILGDNRPNSEDSRYFRPATINKSKIFSKVTKILPGYYNK